MDKEKLKEMISRKFPDVYEGKKMDLILEKIEKCSEDIKTGILRFLSVDLLTDMAIEGYSLERLKKEHGMNEIAAYLTLDWLSREPEKAKKTLARGHDFIKFKSKN